MQTNAGLGRMNSETRGMLLGFLGVSAFSLTLPFTRSVVPYFEPVFIGLGRAVLASFFAAGILLITRQPLPNRAQLQQLSVVAMGVVIGFPVFSAIAMQTVPASHGGVVLGILPLLTAIVGTLVAREKPSARFWATGIFGSAVVAVYSLQEGGGELVIGDMALAAAVFAAAIGYAVGGKLSKTLGGWQVICWTLVLSLPFIAVPAFLHAPVEMSGLPVEAWLSFLYLALVSQLLGFFLWNKGLALGGIARVSQTQLAQPFLTIMFSFLFFSEVIRPSTILFAFLVLIVVGLSKRMPIVRSNHIGPDTMEKKG